MLKNVMPVKNSGHLWLAYIELQGSFNMLQLISVDSGHFMKDRLEIKRRSWEARMTQNGEKESQVGP